MSEPTAEEREEQLVKLRRRMGRLLRRGEMAEFDRLSAVYGRLKAEHVTAVHEEHIVERRAARAALRAQERAEQPKRWKLPFTRSPGAQERDRLPSAPVAVQAPAGGLRPWRRHGGLMSQQIWRPGR